MSLQSYRYQSLQPASGGYLPSLLVLLLVTVIGGYCAYMMEHAGHHITGMNNSIVWGLPHVFAISLIVSASGALNGATLASVFALEHYKPYARLSVALAMSLLIGGLSVLVLDLGRPDRLIIAMTRYNFRSIFTWNIFLYTGFLLVAAVYLWSMLDRQYNKHTKRIGIVALIWRIILTSGTGCIFGFLVGRNALDAAILAPMFIALSLVMGSAVLLMVMWLVARWQGGWIPADVLQSKARLMIWFLLALGYFTLVHHLANLYVAEHHTTERFTLAGPHAVLFWFGHGFIGVLLPMVLFSKLNRLCRNQQDAEREENAENSSDIKTADNGSATLLVLAASGAAFLGGIALVYVIVIGSQSTAQLLFPGKTVVASSFADAGYAAYNPTLWEWGLGLGGLSLALLLCLLAMRVFPFGFSSTR